MNIFGQGKPLNPVDGLLMVLIIVLLFCICSDKKVKATGEAMCPYPAVQRFRSYAPMPDPYNPVNIGKLGQEACCGRRDPYVNDQTNPFEYLNETGIETFCGCGCSCSKCTKCLPTYPGCVPNNQLAGGQLPCDSIGNFWFDYSRLIGNSIAWRILDANGWSMTYDEAVQAIPIGSVVCWNGQPMAKVVSIQQHVNLPDSAFLVLDQGFKINLAGQMVTINPSNKF